MQIASIPDKDQNLTRFAFIIQSEGKGHFSQALEMHRMLKAKGIVDPLTLIGRRPFQPLPEYFKKQWPGSLITFVSPGFIRRADRKGILPLASVVLNLILIPVYLVEALRIRWIIRRSDVMKILNFYDPVGAVACKRAGRGCQVISISHHFYLSHPDFFSPRGFGIQPLLLGFMNNYFIRHSHRILALSYRKGKAFRTIEIVPPLISSEVRNASRSAGSSDLAYLLVDGFLNNLVAHYNQPDQHDIDIFLSLPTGRSASPLETPLAEMEGGGGIKILKADREQYIEKLKSCNRLICTAGFDSVAEALYLEVPVFLIPAEGHFEQYCNALDASRTGLAFQLQSISDLHTADIQPSGYKAFKKWADQSEELISQKIFDEMSG